MPRASAGLCRRMMLAAILAFAGMTGLAHAQDNPTLTIGYVDLIDDQRYLDWGVHPIDIRTGEDLYNRWPLAGAELGIADIKPFEMIAGMAFALEPTRAKDTAAMVAAIKAMRETGIQFVLVDAPTEMLADVAAQLADLDVLLMNVSATGDSVRNAQCQANLMHTAPSDAMMADAMVQFLVDKKWRDVLVLKGPLPQDDAMVAALKRSMGIFGGDIEEIRDFVLSSDPRAREQNDLRFLTGRADYEVVYVADTDGEFALGVPYDTVRPVPVVGSAGLMARAWHWSYLRHGAPQLQGRFQRMHGRRMNATDWGAWVAVRAIGESVVRAKSKDFDGIVQYMKSDALKVDGSKGPSLNFRPWDNQLRQPILLTTENWTVANAPLPAFVHRTNNLDTLGIDERESQCKLKNQ